jgi:quercetin dioxygenase-like cupin family protein
MQINNLDSSKQGYVLGATDGERMFNSSGEVVIKVDPTRSSNDLSLGTQLVPPAIGIPRHVHAYWDEVIYVLDGGGIVTLDDEQVPLQKGATIFVPKGVWHGFENPDTELFILWLASSPGQAEFFRAISSRPGEPAKNLAREQVMAIRQQVEADHLKRVQSES